MSKRYSDSLPDLLPEVSVLTSWTLASLDPFPGAMRIDMPLGLQLALREGVGLFDLYFLNHRDIPWYAQKAAISVDKDCEPHEFAAHLSVNNIKSIADALRKAMTHEYGGKQVGRRPRFVACATFFPLISSEDPGKRRMAVKAVRSTLLLAAELGMRCVEIVGGAGVPGFRDTVTNVEVDRNPDEYRSERMNWLAASIRELFELSPGAVANDVQLELKKLIDSHRLPYIALEIEPGPTFLINALSAFTDLHEMVNSSEVTRAHLCLNIDIAHAFLTGYGPDDIDNLKPYIAHMHLSDHGGDDESGGMHAADLIPARYHFYETAPSSEQPKRYMYKGWMTLAAKLKADPVTYPRFSGAIGIELEARHDINEVLAAINITRQWLITASEETNSSATAANYPEQTDTGAILVIDLGNSTKRFGNKPRSLEKCIRELCDRVLDTGGSVMSYRGDGFIALFEGSHFRDIHSATAKALAATLDICGSIQKRVKSGLTIRAALHWGEVYIPTSGPLRDQVMGPAIICASRLCDFLGHELEPATPVRRRGAMIGATEDFLAVLQSIATESLDWENPVQYEDAKGHQYQWDYWGYPEFKGLGKSHIFILDYSRNLIK